MFLSECVLWNGRSRKEEGEEYGRILDVILDVILVK